MTETRIISFIVRFVQPEGGDHTAPWHGVVRHVQSSEEVRFTRVEEALQFMSRYVPMGQENAAPLAPAGIAPTHDSTPADEGS